MQTVRFTHHRAGEDQGRPVYRIISTDIGKVALPCDVDMRRYWESVLGQSDTDFAVLTRTDDGLGFAISKEATAAHVGEFVKKLNAAIRNKEIVLVDI